VARPSAGPCARRVHLSGRLRRQCVRVGVYEQAFGRAVYLESPSRWQRAIGQHGMKRIADCGSCVFGVIQIATSQAGHPSGVGDAGADRLEFDRGHEPIGSAPTVAGLVRGPAGSLSDLWLQSTFWELQPRPPFVLRVGSQLGFRAVDRRRQRGIGRPLAQFLSRRCRDGIHPQSRCERLALARCVARTRPNVQGLRRDLGCFRHRRFASQLRIPVESGQGFRREGGHYSGVKAATHSDTKAATLAWSSEEWPGVAVAIGGCYPVPGRRASNPLSKRVLSWQLTHSPCFTARRVESFARLDGRLVVDARARARN
jgi:hypothetical protein